MSLLKFVIHVNGRNIKISVFFRSYKFKFRIASSCLASHLVEENDNSMFCSGCCDVGLVKATWRLLVSWEGRTSGTTHVRRSLKTVSGSHLPPAMQGTLQGKQQFAEGNPGESQATADSDQWSDTGGQAVGSQEGRCEQNC